MARRQREIGSSSPPTVALLHHAAKRGMCAMPTVERPKKPEGRIRWLTLDEAI